MVMNVFLIFPVYSFLISLLFLLDGVWFQYSQALIIFFFSNSGNICPWLISLRLCNVTPMLFSISLQVWIGEQEPETGPQVRKKCDILLIWGVGCDTSENGYICVVILLWLPRRTTKFVLLTKPSARFWSLVWLSLPLLGRFFQADRLHLYLWRGEYFLLLGLGHLIA